jgi:hypothetical protein
LARAPFVGQTQYDQAQRLLAVPYATFRRLGHALPAVESLIVTYATGRAARPWSVNHWPSRRPS